MMNEVFAKSHISSYATTWTIVFLIIYLRSTHKKSGQLRTDILIINVETGHYVNMGKEKQKLLKSS